MTAKNILMVLVPRMILAGVLSGSSQQDHQQITYKSRSIGLTNIRLDQLQPLDDYDELEDGTFRLHQTVDTSEPVEPSLPWQQYEDLDMDQPTKILTSGWNRGQADNSKTAYTRDFGTYIGRLRPRAHGIAGSVYAVDENNLFVRNFRYDGTGPDAYFWVGDTSQPSPRGRIVPYPPIDTYTTTGMRSSVGGSKPQEAPTLKKMRNENVLLTLPGNLKVSDVRWLSIWCRRFTVNYGEVYIPKDVQVPEKVNVDQLSNREGKLSSGPITILDAESFYIRNMQMLVIDNGFHFWVGNSTSMQPDQQGFMVANEKARYDDLKVYNGQDIIITLPKGTTMFDINYLAVYNEETMTNLGHIQFDIRSTRLPPALGQTKKPGWWFDIPTTSPPPVASPPPPQKGGEKPPFVPFNHTLQLPNCRELLGRKIRLLWLQQDDGHIYFRIKVHMDPTQFVAIGIAAAPGSPMIEADFVRIFLNASSNQFAVEDAFLSKKLMCDFSTGGLCSDDQHNSMNHVTFMGAMKNHGLAIVDFRRSIMPHDAHDVPIPMEGPTQVIVAIGSLRQTSDGPYSANSALNLETENVTIEFSSNDNYCPDTTSLQRLDSASEDKEVWDKSIIKDIDLFVARLGPTGGRKGYGAITSEPPSEKSVCWWINGKLMPDIYVERGKTYYFRVQGGDGNQHFDSNHPLYITNHREGGYGSKTPYERERETIYAGVDLGFSGAGEPQPTGVGPLCEYVSSDGADKAEESATFEDYKKTLQVACEQHRAHDYGWVNWTVSQDTPDLVYYQSYYSYGLGWKINVLDEGEEPNSVMIIRVNNVMLTTFTMAILLGLLLTTDF